MTDSYHFQIEPEPRAEVAKFRVGGVYRAHNGILNRVTAVREDNERFGKSPIEVYMVNVLTGREAAQNGWRTSEGAYPGDSAGQPFSLIPGELVLRDGQWIPLEQTASLTFPSGATLKVAGDKIVGRVEAKLVTAGGASYVLSMGGSVTVYCVGGGGGGGGSGSPVQRAPLPNSDEWRGIGHKAHDTFGSDFIVTKGEVPTAPLHTSPTTDSAHPAIAGLLRG